MAGRFTAVGLDHPAVTDPLRANPYAYSNPFCSKTNLHYIGTYLNSLETVLNLTLGWKDNCPQWAKKSKEVTVPATNTFSKQCPV